MLPKILKSMSFQMFFDAIEIMAEYLVFTFLIFAALYASIILLSCLHSSHFLFFSLYLSFFDAADLNLQLSFCSCSSFLVAEYLNIAETSAVFHYYFQTYSFSLFFAKFLNFKYKIRIQI